MTDHTADIQAAKARALDIARRIASWVNYLPESVKDDAAKLAADMVADAEAAAAAALASAAPAALAPELTAVLPAFVAWAEGEAARFLAGATAAKAHLAVKA